MKVKKILIIFFFLFFASFAQALTFKVASYNVENLFDMTKSGTEYPDYIPDGSCGWTRHMLDIKLNNVAKVIKDLKADIIALQEIESEKALVLLQKRLKKKGVFYPYYAIADSRATAVKCALLSKFPVVDKKEIATGTKADRNILKVTLDVDGNPFTVFVNHWKSKRGPESRRVEYAKSLKKSIDKLDEDADFVLTGDFNSNYNEFKTFKKSRKFNNTKGVTGINNILMTVKDSKMVDEKLLTDQSSNEYLYNLWLEIKKKRRWSNNFYGRKGSLDNIIVSRGLYDDSGILYVDNSFDKFDPDYLFLNRALFRWQRAERGRGEHLGAGYSDHLPVYAFFRTN